MEENVKEIKVYDWGNMSLDELFSQRTMMYDRYEYLLGTKKEYAASILEGLQRLEGLIANKVSK